MHLKKTVVFNNNNNNINNNDNNDNNSVPPGFRIRDFASLLHTTLPAKKHRESKTLKRYTDDQRQKYLRLVIDYD